MDYQNNRSHYGFFYITEWRSVEFQVGGTTFTAYRHCLVKIPNYVPRSFRSRGDSVMYDLGGMTHWLDVIEDYRSVKLNKPERLQDRDYIRAILHRHACYVKTFGAEQLL